ncbi:MAG TPA: hypothetical protein VMF32_26390 [Xanthobacteraceae bacterium]|nr:hypothetical protein [Xanthobacteraceae bacterium]
MNVKSKSTRRTVLTLAAMWAGQRLRKEMIYLDELLTDLPRECEMSVLAIVAEAASLLGPGYADIPTTTEEAMDLLEEIAGDADNDIYAIAHAMRPSSNN